MGTVVEETPLSRCIGTAGCPVPNWGLLIQRRHLQSEDVDCARAAGKGTSAKQLLHGGAEQEPSHAVGAAFGW